MRTRLRIERLEMRASEAMVNLGKKVQIPKDRKLEQFITCNATSRIWHYTRNGEYNTQRVLCTSNGANGWPV